MGFSLGKLVGGVVKSVEGAVSSGAKSVEKAAGGVVDGVKHAADIFENGMVVPFLNQGNRTNVSAEPAPMKVDGQTPKYGKVDGQLFVGGVKPEDIDQGAAGDCYYLASLAAVAKTHPELIQNAIKQNADGTYSVQFHNPPGMDWMHSLGIAGVNSEGYVTRLLEHVGLKPSGTSTVKMDGQLPTLNGRDPFDHSNSNELWGPLMEKAFAKYWGGYGAVGNGGEGGVSLMMLTGAPIDRIGLGNADKTWSEMSQASAANQPMVATRYHKGEHNGLIDDHVYSVLGTEVINGEKYVDLRNPWGETEPGNDGNDDGEFKMKLSDFVKEYSYVDVARTPPTASKP